MKTKVALFSKETVSIGNYCIRRLIASKAPCPRCGGAGTFKDGSVCYYCNGKGTV